MFEIEINTILFLAVVALGAVVQSDTGFAMGLVTMVGITVLGVADIAFSAAVVSFISMAIAVLVYSKDTVRLTGIT